MYNEDDTEESQTIYQFKDKDIAYTVFNVPIKHLKPYKNHPFKVLNDNAMSRLIDDIDENGLINPILVREIPFTADFEILSGHRRLQAVKRLGWDEVEVAVSYYTDDEAASVVINSNFLHRDKILPSEKAKSFKLRNDCLKRQKYGRKSPVGTEEEKLIQDIIAAEFNESKTSIFRYMRLNYLIDELLDLTDENILSVRAAVDLSYFSEDRQRIIYKYFFVDKKARLKADLVNVMRREYPTTLNTDILNKITAEEPNKKKISKNHIVQRYLNYFEDDKTAEKKIIEILDAYFANRNGNF